MLLFLLALGGYFLIISPSTFLQAIINVHLGYFDGLVILTTGL